MSSIARFYRRSSSFLASSSRPSSSSARGPLARRARGQPSTTGAPETNRPNRPNRPNPTSGSRTARVGGDDGSGFWRSGRVGRRRRDTRGRARAIDRSLDRTRDDARTT